MEAKDKTESTKKSLESDELLLKMEKYENYHAEASRSILSEKDDEELLQLLSKNTRKYETIVRDILAERYVDKYFVVEGESERHQKIYSEQFILFGESIKAIQMNRLQYIDKNHWLVKLLNKHTPNLEKLYFKQCLFRNVNNVLSQYPAITHLTIRDGFNEKSYSITLPQYSNLKSIELVNSPYISKSSLEYVLCNNPQLERLIIRGCRHMISMPIYSNEDYIESIEENLPNLRCLSIQNIAQRTNAQILTILRKCKSLEELVFCHIITWCSWYRPTFEEKSTNVKNKNFHDEFIKTIHNPHIRLDFVENDEIIGTVTKDEIIWRNKLLHWVGYDSINSHSDLRLLDLATLPVHTKAKHKQPLYLIFNYLDLSSLYSFCMVSKKAKQQVHNYLYQRCKPSKRRAKHRSIEKEKFVLTDEFGLNLEPLKVFGKLIRYLDIELFEYSYGEDLLNIIEKHCKLLTILCFRTHPRVNPEKFILPQIQHYIFYGYGVEPLEIYHCDLNDLSRKCPNLEILDIKTPIKLYDGFGKRKFVFKNLRTIKFKPYDESEVQKTNELFENTETEIVVY